MSDSVRGRRDGDFPPFGVRRVGYFNTLGIWTLYAKEVKRFLKVWMQTVAAPVVTSLLFMAILTLAVGQDRPPVHGVPFVHFLAPGLVMMTVVQNAFANTSSSIIISKVQGNVVDLLMPPLSAGEITFAFAMGGVTRGALVAVVTLTAMSFVVPLMPAHLWAVVFFGITASLMLSLIGMLGGIWADKFDHIATVTNFVITPFAFLSGTFYPIDALPPAWHAVALANPFFHMIDGFRYGFLGQADGNVMVGVVVMTALCAALWFACWKAFATGWHLKT